MSLPNNKLAWIHIVKKELKLSDREYRKILRREAGVDSARDLDETKFKRLMRYFVRSPYFRANPAGLTVRQKLFIRNLAQRLGWDQGHFKNFLHKYYHRRRLNRLTRVEASKVIVALQHILQSRPEKAGPAAKSRINNFRRDRSKLKQGGEARI